jgi:hypothetical protein
MLAEVTDECFIFQALTTESGELPEYGARMFGFVRNSDHTVTFYTRATSRPADFQAQAGGSIFQPAAWLSWTHGIGEQIQSMGGQVIERDYWTTLNTP